MKTLADNLNRLMDKHHESNQRLADACGVANGAIHRIRHATTAVTLTTLEKLARHYRLEPWQLLIEDLDDAHPPQLAYPNSEELALYERFKKFITESK